MCDYSLHHVASRPAVVGDKLITTAFNYTLTRGFTVESAPDVAVCLRPGTEVAFESGIEFYDVNKMYNANSTTVAEHRVARFRKVNEENAFAHHDALEFPDGTVLLLTLLLGGQRATVLQLPAEPKQATAEAAPMAELVD